MAYAHELAEALSSLVKNGSSELPALSTPTLQFSVLSVPLSCVVLFQKQPGCGRFSASTGGVTTMDHTTKAPSCNSLMMAMAAPSPVWIAPFLAKRIKLYHNDHLSESIFCITPLCFAKPAPPALKP